MTDVSKTTTDLCSDCPPIGYPTDNTRCSECPRRVGKEAINYIERKLPLG